MEPFSQCKSQIPNEFLRIDGSKRTNLLIKAKDERERFREPHELDPSLL